jgi:hypothetical protein
MRRPLSPRVEIQQTVKDVMIMNSTARTLGNVIIKISNPERVPQLANPFRVNNGIYYSTQGSRCAVLEPWAGISQRLRRFQPEPVPESFTICTLSTIGAEASKRLRSDFALDLKRVTAVTRRQL